jgi:hypothetical protein
MNRIVTQWDGLTARQKIISPIIAVIMLWIASIPSVAQSQDANAEKLKDVVATTKESTTNAAAADISSSSSTADVPLVLRKDLIMPYSYNPDTKRVPDFLSLDHLRYPVPLRRDDLSTPGRSRDEGEYLSRTEESGED